MGIKQKGGFTTQLGDSKLTPMMRLDATFNDNGQYIGKVLGEMVASSADAVKDPVLNLMNINVETVNILNSLIRLGVPFKTAAMFLSSKAISNALNDYYKESLT
jgi:energy-converting hydrogenase Eha subunit E